MASALEIFEPKLFAGAVADELVASIQDAIAERGSCSIVLAGGTTPGVIYRALSKPPRVSEVEWSKLSLFWGDERWVPHTDTQSNFMMAKETLLADLPKNGPRVYPVNTQLATPQEGAVEYAKVVKDALGVAAGTPPIFDIVILGVGEDGHTASLFPRAPEVLATGTVAHAVQSPTRDSWRVTLSPDALFSARRILFIVRGDSKADIVKRVLEGPGSAEELPAKLYQRASEAVTWCLDSSAAQKLERRG